jgi:hypothetical protein
MAQGDAIENIIRSCGGEDENATALLLKRKR